MLVAEALHPVASPAIDRFGNIYTTFSGSRGQKTPVAVFKIDLNYNVKPFITELMNATGITFDRDGMMTGCDVIDGHDLETAIDALFADSHAAYLHAHFARPGCYAARIDRC